MWGMEQVIIINIGAYKMLGLIATIIGGAWYASARFTKIESEVKGVDKRLERIEYFIFDKRSQNSQN